MSRGIIDKNINKSNIDIVKLVSPSNKLKINKNKTDEMLKDTDKKTKEEYIMTKHLSVEYCNVLITDENKNKLNTYKKKDDLCDSFLQGFQYVYNPVP